MKHATGASLDRRANLLEDIRKHRALTEEKRGIFYVKSAAFLHFHEDPAGLFADLKTGTTWERLPVNTPRQQAALLAKLR